LIFMGPMMRPGRRGDLMQIKCTFLKMHIVCT
jgi:hypothetical protein